MSSLDRTDVAELWHECAQLSRRDIFGPADKLRPKYKRHSLGWQIDVATFGMVGGDYDQNGVVILSVNPAGGKYDNTSDFLDDRVYERFRDVRDPSPNASARETFEAINDAYRSAMPRWTITRHYRKIWTALGKHVDDFSFLQVVPFRTAGDNGSSMSREYIMKGYERHLKKQLFLLAPGMIIAMDRPSKAVGELYRHESGTEIKVRYWNRGYHVSDAERFEELLR